MEEEEVIIIVKDDRFAVSKQALRENSDYFRAMFSGNFRDHDQQEFNLDFVDTATMELIIKHLGNFQNLSLNKYTLSKIYNVAEAASFLQLTELTNKIESFIVPIPVSTSTWFELRKFAENMSYANLKQNFTEFGFPPLRDMEPQYVPSVQELVWYLSHTHLYVTNEYDVFKFGMDWMSHSNTDITSEIIQMCLGCLDMSRITTSDLIQIRILCLSVYELIFDHCLASDVIYCLTEVSKCNTIITTEGIEQVKGKISKTARDETLKLVEYSRRRQIERTIIVPVINHRSENGEFTKTEYLQMNPKPGASSDQTHPSLNSINYCFPNETVDLESGVKNKLCMFHPNTALKTWLDLDIKNNRESCYSTWDIAAWGPRNLVLVINTDCIESEKYFFEKLRYLEISIYNFLKKKWTTCNAKIGFSKGVLRRVVVIGNRLYIFCDNGDNITHNLTTDGGRRSSRKIAYLPSRASLRQSDNTLFSCTCTHNDELYVSDRHMVYKYNVTDDVWVKIIEHDSKILNMVSHNHGFIYVADDNRNLSKFKPDTDETMNTITKLKFNVPFHCYSLESRLLFFTDAPDGTLSIQEYRAGSDGETSQFEELWALKSSALKFDSKRNVCSLVMTTHQ